MMLEIWCFIYENQTDGSIMVPNSITAVVKICCCYIKPIRWVQFRHLQYRWRIITYSNVNRIENVRCVITCDGLGESPPEGTGGLNIQPLISINVTFGLPSADPWRNTGNACFILRHSSCCVFLVPDLSVIVDYITSNASPRVSNLEQVIFSFM